MKKRNKIIHIINWCLLFSIPFILLTVNVSTSTTQSVVDTKNLSTSLFSKVEEVEAVVVNEEESLVDTVSLEESTLEVVEEQDQVKTAISNDTEEVEKSSTEVVKEPQKEEVIEEKPKETEASDVLATYTGKMSFYNANCAGCSGITSTGVDVSDGRVYYQDGKYGQVRIVAAGTEIKKWSIIRIKNSSVGSSVLAIVLDRGGNIGSGKKFLIDMLTNGSEAFSGVDKNVTVEVLRNGK